jgi:hypothetical protein
LTDLIKIKIYDSDGRIIFSDRDEPKTLELRLEKCFKKLK